ncbi:MAG: thiamine phosphate synthase [Clostridiales bacterium]
MEKLYRVIDANVNRASEGIRVIEDIGRFYLNHSELTSDLREIRHKIRDIAKIFLKNCLIERDSIKDIGLDISIKSNLSNKTNIIELIEANFKRVQEALRTLEEVINIVGHNDISREFEVIRFKTYYLEKEIYFKIKINLVKSEKNRKLDTDIYCITSYEHSKGRNNIDVITEMLEENIEIIQYREKNKSLAEKYRECIEIRELTLKYKATFIINDDIHIAKMVNADGVHIGQDDLPIDKVREFLGEDFIIGISTHSKDQCIQSINSEADYIGVGPIFKTYTKKDVCDPVGLSYLSYVSKNVKIPFVAIGGIKEHNLASVLKEKPKMIALVTEIVGADDIRAKIRSIRKIMRENKGREKDLMNKV